VWAGNGSCVEVIWKNFKDKIFDGIKCYVPQKILNKNPYPQYYNKEVKRLKIKVRKMYNKNILAALPSGSEIFIQGIMVAKKKAQETFLRSILQNEGRCWTEIYKYVKRRKGNRETIPAFKDQFGRLVTDPIGKAKSLNSYNGVSLQLRRQ